MSWDSYITNLTGSGNFDKAALFSAAGDSVWAASPGWKITSAEAKKWSSIFSNKAARDNVFGEGVHVAGIKYMTIKAEEGHLYGKKGKEGIMIVKTKQAMLVGHYPESVVDGNAANTIERLADYLKGVGY